MFKNWAITCLVAVMQSGCAVYEFPSKVPDQLEELRSKIIPGKTSREEVQAHLGEAFINGKQVEVYRVLSGYDVSLEGPMIPVVWDTEEVIIYALVVYDENGVAQSIDWDVYQRDYSRWGMEQQWRSARLQAGGFYFAALKEGRGTRKEFLLAPPSETTNTFQNPPPAGMCTVVMSFHETFFFGGYGGLKTQYYLDGEIVGETPFISRVFSWAPHTMDVFSKFIISSGEHELMVKTSLEPRKFRSKLFCEPENVFYAYPQIELVETDPYGLSGMIFKYEGEVAISNERLEWHGDWQRLLFYNGRWLGED